MVEPRAFEELTGIWRTVRQGVLEIRADGRYVLITPITRPAEGRITLTGARVTLIDPDSCDGAPGTYTVAVVAAGRMVLSDPDDLCADRRTVLVADPFVYTPR